MFLGTLNLCLNYSINDRNLFYKSNYSLFKYKFCAFYIPFANFFTQPVTYDFRICKDCRREIWFLPDGSISSVIKIYSDSLYSYRVWKTTSFGVRLDSSLYWISPGRIQSGTGHTLIQRWQPTHSSLMEGSLFSKSQLIA